MDQFSFIFLSVFLCMINLPLCFFILSDTQKLQIYEKKLFITKSQVSSKDANRDKWEA